MSSKPINRVMIIEYLNQLNIINKEKIRNIPELEDILWIELF